MELGLAPAWRDYRNRLAAVVAAIVGLVLYLDGGDALLRDLLVTDGLVDGAFPCPWCRASFHWTLWDVNPIADRCLHCGFRKWRDPDAARVLTRR